VTLTTTTARTSYPGTGTTGPFAIPFKIFSSADLLVTKRTALGSEVTLALTTDYTVDSTLSILTTVAAVASGETLWIRRAPALTQPTSIRNQGTYFPATIEDEFDRIVMQIQDTRDRLDRSFGLTETYDPNLYTLKIPPGSAGQVLGWVDSTHLGNLTVATATGVTLPGAPRTVTSLSTYLANNAVSVNIKDVGLLANGITDERALLNNLFNVSMQPNGGTVLISGTPRISSALTVPANITLDYAPGAFWVIDNGVTLTDLSRNYRRMRIQRYSTTGTVVYGFDGPVYPEWWGAKADNVADDSAAIMAASIAVPTSNVQGGAVEFSPGAVYKITNTVLVSSEYHLRWYAHAQATINVQVGAGNWGVDINLVPISPDYASFSTANISIVDLNQTRTRKGIRLARCLEGKFERLWMYGFTTMMDAKTDSDHNVFVNCFFSNNTLCHTSSDNVAVDNIFIGCNWLSSDVVFDGTWQETNILGGTMEPSNGLAGNPFFVTGDNCHCHNLRFERNTNNQEWMRVGSSCYIECSFQGDGAHQANPAIRFYGSESFVTVRVGTVAQLAIFDAVSARNKLAIQGPTLLLNNSVYVLDNAPTAGNTVETSLGIMGTDAHVVKVPHNLVSSYLDDATWVRANLTSVLPNGPDYQAIASGAGTPTITATLTGTFQNLYLAFTGRYNNIAGDITVTVAGTVVQGASLSTTRRRIYLAFKGPFTNPTIQLAMGGSGAGSAWTIGALSVSDRTFSANADPQDPRAMIFMGTGTPVGQIVASPGALYLRRDGGAVTSLYVKESGLGTNTGWVAK
jgi:hypothetical protein